MIKAIFFDFDGVIVESVDIKTQAFAALFEPEGKEAVKKIVGYHMRHAGVSRYDKFRYIYKDILRRPLSDDEFRRLCDKFSSLVIDEVVNARYVDGAKEFLENSASRYLCYVMSATPQEEIEDIIARRGIGKYFKKIYGAPFKKTDAVREALLNAGLDGVCAAYVGDALSDYAAARENSVNFIARIYKNEEQFADMPCEKIRDLKGLGAAIDKL